MPAKRNARKKTYDDHVTGDLDITNILEDKPLSSSSQNTTQQQKKNSFKEIQQENEEEAEEEEELEEEAPKKKRKVATKNLEKSRKKNFNVVTSDHTFRYDDDGILILPSITATDTPKRAELRTFFEKNLKDLATVCEVNPATLTADGTLWWSKFIESRFGKVWKISNDGKKTTKQIPASSTIPTSHEAAYQALIQSYLLDPITKYEIRKYYTTRVEMTKELTSNVNVLPKVGKGTFISSQIKQEPVWNNEQSQRNASEVKLSQQVMNRSYNKMIDKIVGKPSQQNVLNQVTNVDSEDEYETGSEDEQQLQALNSNIENLEISDIFPTDMPIMVEKYVQTDDIIDFSKSMIPPQELLKLKYYFHGNKADIGRAVLKLKEIDCQHLHCEKINEALNATQQQLSFVSLLVNDLQLFEKALMKGKDMVQAEILQRQEEERKQKEAQEALEKARIEEQERIALEAKQKEEQEIHKLFDL